MQNKYPGKCDYCGVKVAEGAGTVIRGAGRWIVRCAECSSPRPAVAPAPHKSYFLKPEDSEDLQEWTAAWDRVVPGEDKEELNPLCLEVWQYMGTWLINDQWVHQFRHRSHPKTNQRVLKNIPVTPYFARVLREGSREVTTW